MHFDSGGRSGQSTRSEVVLSQVFDRNLVPVQELVGLGAGEDAGGGADRAHAARPHGAGELQAVELGEAVEQAGDVAGVEGVAAAGAVDEVDRIGAEPDPDDRRRPRSPRARPRVITTRLAPMSRKA